MLIDDGSTALLTDGFFTRPSWFDVKYRRLASSDARITEAMDRAGINRVAAVLPVHTHWDHALDSVVVAQRTGAVMVGGGSAANIARGGGLAEDRIVVAQSGTEMTFGPYAVTLIESHHCPPDRFPGTITQPLVPPAKATAYRCGDAWSTLLEHRPTARRLLIQGTAGFVPGALDGRRADVAYLAAGQLGIQPSGYIEEYWNQTVRAVGARRVVLIHWDDFFRPLNKPLRAFTYSVDNLDVSMAALGRLADRDGVALHLPTLWERADPWA